MIGDPPALSYATQETPRGLRMPSSSGANSSGKRPSHWFWATTSSTAMFAGDAVARIVAPEGRDHLRYVVNTPEQYGVWKLGSSGRRAVDRGKTEAAEIECPRSPAFIFYDNDVLDIRSQCEPSGRGELEITDRQQSLSRTG